MSVLCLPRRSLCRCGRCLRPRGGDFSVSPPRLRRGSVLRHDVNLVPARRGNAAVWLGCLPRLWHTNVLILWHCSTLLLQRHLCIAVLCYHGCVVCGTFSVLLFLSLCHSVCLIILPLCCLHDNTAAVLSFQEVFVSRLCCCIAVLQLWRLCASVVPLYFLGTLAVLLLCRCFYGACVSAVCR